ncbi:zinc finger CCCH domain-containing protein 15 homolog isoform X2 [Tachypleus tridentatus]|uniref:zinc finger CCCH domain-containing protein 15 homolog isoform X2 n=1 Tax=Tachypleus tridentatus TaxID=6853 RepID=UPI003FD004C5
MVLFLLSLVHVKQLVKLQEHLTGSTSRKKNKEIEDLNLTLKSVTTQKDEKEQCKKGDKCKFSQDDVENKSEKKSIYVDLRDEAGAKSTLQKHSTV